MTTPNLDNALVLIYDSTEKTPRGTGFFINEYGHFVTAKHVLDGIYSIKDQLGCRWRGNTYHIDYIDSIKSYRDALTCGKIKSDLILLRILFNNPNFHTDFFTMSKVDVADAYKEGLDVYWKGYRTEGIFNQEEATPSLTKATLSHFDQISGTWNVQGDQTVYKGFSGSPVIDSLTQNVSAVVIQQGEQAKNEAAILPIHQFLYNLDKYGYDSAKILTTPDLPYKNYYQYQSQQLKENWPYAIDEDDFVDCFDIETYSPASQTHKIHTQRYCIPYIVGILQESPIFCLGFYGMGKTTLAKHLFTHYFRYSNTEYPVFISLRDKDIATFCREEIEKLIADKIVEANHSFFKENHYRSLPEVTLQKYAQAFLKGRNILLILDGIDEAIHNQGSFALFCNFLKTLKVPFFLTSRKEFFGFVDSFKKRMSDFNHEIIELLPWHEKQWKKYSDALKNKYPLKTDNISDFYYRISNKVYGTLPSRPLFLKMIADLEVEDNHLEIHSDLRTNRSAIYYEYLRWKIKDEYTRKGVEHQNEIMEIHFQKDSFELFKELARIEYISSLPKNTEGSSFTNNDKYKIPGFTDQDIKTICKNYLTQLEFSFVKKHITQSSFFSIITSSDLKIWRFSHKSFCEYLVAYDLASSIFGNETTDANCGKSWRLYQTHEVSSHFKDEVKRICHPDNLNLSEEDRNQYVRSAFEKELANQSDYGKYSELVEEILYYSGLFKINSPQIIQILENLIKNPSAVDPTYYRTAHLSLAMIKSSKYCLKYLEVLVESYKKDRNAFNRNQKIQRDYYGRSNLHEVLVPFVKTFIHEGVMENIVPLKIFSYFTCIPFEENELPQTLELLSLARQACDKFKQTRMGQILDDVVSIVKTNTHNQP